MNAIEVSGLTKRYGRVAAEIIAGYVLGFLGLATSQAIAGLAEAIWLFELDYDEETLVMLFAVVWLLAIASVMPGIFISTFARHEDQVFPFVSLIILPSVFFSGLLVDVEELPTWADWLGHAFPLFWANDVIQDVIESGWTFEAVQGSLAVLVAYSVAVLLLASLTLREIE
ncbi:MAG TPA: ABC transporter permease [Rubrobacter sp.]|nr:ABC transporter permease [Rubrobacter sp.]